MELHLIKCWILVICMSNIVPDKILDKLWLKTKNARGVCNTLMKKQSLIVGFSLLSKHYQLTQSEKIIYQCAEWQTNSLKTAVN